MDNMTTQTFPVHDESAWVCTRCGAVNQKPFSLAHRPVTNPGIRTCGGVVVPAHLYSFAKEKLEAAFRAAMARLQREESGQPLAPGSGGAYGLYQSLPISLGGN